MEVAICAETVRTIIEAFAEGRIKLPPLDDKKGHGGLRTAPIAPSFKVATWLPPERIPSCRPPERDADGRLLAGLFLGRELLTRATRSTSGLGFLRDPIDRPP